MSIKTNWTDPGASTPDISGAGVTSRGSDPQVDLGGTSGLSPLWPSPVVPTPSGEETANMSELPLTPQRWEPSDQPPPPPTLDQRNPGTLKG